MLFTLLAGLMAAADPVPLTVKVGESVALCATGTIQCPAANPICDDTSVATAEVTAEGLVLRGVKKGTTLCSAAGASGFGQRQVYRVVVKDK